MPDVIVFGIMLLSAAAPFTLATYWMQNGKVGYTLTLFSLIGALFVIGMFIVARVIGSYTNLITGGTLLVLLPALLGCMAGALLGWLIYRRRYG